MANKRSRWSTPAQRRQRLQKLQERRDNEDRDRLRDRRGWEQFDVMLHDAVVDYLARAVPARAILFDVLFTWGATFGAFHFSPSPEFVALLPDHLRGRIPPYSANDRLVRLNSRDIASLRDAFALRSRTEDSAWSRLAFHRMYVALDKRIREEEAVQRRMT